MVGGAGAAYDFSETRSPGSYHPSQNHHIINNRPLLKVMNPGPSRGTSVGSRVSHFFAWGHGAGSGNGSHRGAGSEHGGYGWEREREREPAQVSDRDRSFDPFDDMSEINGPTAFVARTHTPSAYAQAQYEKYSEGHSPVSVQGLQRGGSLSHSAYSGYASERR